MEKNIGSFEASDAAGTRYAITIWQEQIDATDNEDREETSIGGMSTLRTQDGRMVRRVSKGRYALGGVELVSNDPDAP